MVIEYKASVEKDLRRPDSKQAFRVLVAIERALKTEGRGGEALSGPFAGLFKLRGADYRVIYARTENRHLVASLYGRIFSDVRATRSL